MKTISFVIIAVLLGFSITSCTPESIINNTAEPQACCDDDSSIPPPPPPVDGTIGG